MTLRRIAIALVLLQAPLLAGYTYYYSDTFSNTNSNPYGVPTGPWTTNGTLNTVYTGSGGQGGLVATFGNNGSIISTAAVPDGTSQYEVSTTISLRDRVDPISGLTVHASGDYVHYLQATPDALTGSTPSGTFYSVELQNVTNANSACSATLVINQRVGGVITTLASTQVVCYDGMTLRSVTIPVDTGSQHVYVYIGEQFLASVYNVTPFTGKPGVGLRSTLAGMITLAQFGPLDRVAPSAIDSNTIRKTVFPNSIELRWQPANDANGIGVFDYHVYRDGVWLGWYPTPALTDETVAPSTTYAYFIRAFDYHGNVSGFIGINITTPPAGVGDPRRVGVASQGSYWGGGGEQIDMRSANLNFSLPLLSAKGRGGWSVPFALTYNSQNWRSNNSDVTNLGADVGYGYGWQLLAGSITPYPVSGWVPDHWIFTDSSGTEYRLNVNNNGIWTSTQGIYVFYDSNTGKLLFPDGSFWMMTCTSAGTEQDAGTRYPMLMQDTNGNQVFIRYKAGVNAYWNNSSSRIEEIEDVTAGLVGYYDQNYKTYIFHYNSDALPHLVSIEGPRNFSFSLGSFALVDPFTGQSFGNTTLLQSVTVTNIGTYTVGYNNNYGEVTQVTFPYGGYLRWVYSNFTYAGQIKQREVTSRYLLKASGAAETSVTFAHDPNDPSHSFHYSTTLSDAGGSSWPASQKKWQFDTTTGLIQTFSEGTSSTALRTQNYTWTVQPTSGNSYISAILLTNDNSQQSKTEQTVDAYGNLTQQKVYDWGNLSTPAKTYDNTYFQPSNYISLNILNRLQISTVRVGTTGTPLQLVNNTYDSVYNPNGWASGGPSNTYSREYAYVANVRGNVLSRTVPGSTVNFSLYPSGEVASATDSLGHTVSTTESSNSNYAVPTAITPNGNSNFANSMSWDSNLNLTQNTRPNGASTSFTYDTSQRPQTTTSADGATTTFSYSSNPGYTLATTNGHWVKTWVDGFGRTIKVERGDAGTTKSTVETEYQPCARSPLGKVYRVSQPYAPNGTKYWTTYAHDTLGRTLTVTAPDNSVTTYLYSGNTVKVTDPANKWKTYTMDAMGNLTQAEEPRPGGGSNYSTAYTYDLLNHLIGVSMPRDGATQTRTFTYDTQGINNKPPTWRLIGAANPESGTTQYTYNDDGTLQKKTNASGSHVDYTYDTYKRVTDVRFFQADNSEDSCSHVINTYDSSTEQDGGNPFSQNGQGRLVKSEWGRRDCAGGHFLEFYSYSQSGHMIKKRLRWGYGGDQNGDYWAANVDTSATYDNEGKMATQTYPDNSLYTYTYDSMGRPVSMNTDIHDISYGPADEILQLTVGTGGQPGYYTETRTYNNRLQATRITATAGSALMDMEYRYTAGQNNGRISQSKDWVTGEEVTYAYDSLQRLISAVTTGPEWGLSFSYDGFGNYTGESVTKGSGPNWSQAITASTNRVNAFGYDSNGNVTYMPPPASTTMTYDAANRLVTSMTSMYSDAYSYGPDNRRRSKGATSGYGPSEIYFYGITGQKILALGPFLTNTPPTWLYNTVHKYVYFGARLVSTDGTSVIRDRLGSVRVMYGYTPTFMSYFPYGEERTTGTPTDTEKFGTYFRDQHTGFDYAKRRYYQSTMGRFLTPDPKGGRIRVRVPLGLNRYVYSNDDPINGSDPSGLDTIMPRSDDMTLFTPTFTPTYNTTITITNVDAPAPINWPLVAQGCVEAVCAAVVVTTATVLEFGSGGLATPVLAFGAAGALGGAAIAVGDISDGLKGNQANPALTQAATFMNPVGLVAGAVALGIGSDLYWPSYLSLAYSGATIFAGPPQTIWPSLLETVVNVYQYLATPAITVNVSDPAPELPLVESPIGTELDPGDTSTGGMWYGVDDGFFDDWWDWL